MGFPEVHLIVSGREQSSGKKPGTFYLDLAHSIVDSRIRWHVRHILESKTGIIFTAADHPLLTYSADFRSASGVLVALLRAWRYEGRLIFPVRDEPANLGQILYLSPPETAYIMSKKYIVGFNRDRDYYQVPLAVEEAGLLETLVTDLYVPDSHMLSWFYKKFGLNHRCVSGLPSVRVKQSLRIALLQMRLKGASPADRLRLFTKIDQIIGEISAKVAIRRNCDLFMYSGYAKESFSHPLLKDRRKLLFVYHPFSHFTDRILQEDAGNYAEIAQSHQQHMMESKLSDMERIEEELMCADQIICASNFTGSSVKGFCRSQNPAIIPYGAFPLEAGIAIADPKKRRPRILFVGQGVQRKGLHHLLRVWNSNHSWEADLTLVVNNVDPGLNPLLNQHKSNIQIKTKLTRMQLQQEFQKADIFIMPSLVEGFGLVYLEAFAAGCFVIGSGNTGLPDLQVPEWAGLVIQAGNLSAIENALCKSIDFYRKGLLDAEAIRKFVSYKSWDSFRVNVRKFLDKERMMVSDLH